MEIKKLFNGIYENKTVLVTGHTGFKGSWMALWLKELEANVVGLSLEPPTKPNHFELLDLNISSIIGDIRNKELVTKVFTKFKPEVVFHMAAQPLVRYSYENPTETYETNVMGTLNILEASRTCGTVKAIVCITTDKCYENKEWEWGYRECDRLGGHDPYSSSKACAEILAASYRDSFFSSNKYKNTHNTLVATVRAGNVIGGGDWAVDRLIPDLMKSINNMETLHIRSPHSTRPWQHVLEPLSGYLMVGEQLLKENKDFAQAWNFGPNDSSVLTVKKVVDFIKNEWNNFEYICDQEEADLHEAKLLKLDSSKAHNKLKWIPIWNPEQTFKITTNWYRNYFTENKILSKHDLYTYSTMLQERQ